MTDDCVPATPRVLWIELTSKCPFDCVFCSRKLRRGEGRHLPFAVYRRLVESLVDPRRLILNYSGESICYPELVPAIELARSRGAFVELVSAWASIKPELMQALASCGLGRLTISVHAADPRRYREIYRYGSFPDLEARAAGFLDLCRRAKDAPAVDFAFVAMQRNLDQLRPVAEFAQRLGIRDIQIFPVQRRDEIPVEFRGELASSDDYTAEFRRDLQASIEETQQACREVNLSISNTAFGGNNGCLGEVPVPFSGELPAGAHIHTCEQNPWETAHVLSNGDVVACEVLDHTALGNLTQQPIETIWTANSYRDLRHCYRAGEIAECRRCLWKRAYRPAPLRSEILARNGASAQLLHGWHAPSNENVMWSTQRSAAVIQPRRGSRAIHLSGSLPPGIEDANELLVAFQGRQVGRIVNATKEMLPFGRDLEIFAEGSAPWCFEFRTTQMLRPSDRGISTDCRDLGFALVSLSSNRPVDSEREKRQMQQLEPLRRWIDRVDRLGTQISRIALKVGQALGLLSGHRLGRSGAGATANRPGVSIVIPERDNIGELSTCLESVAAAAARTSEPVEVVIVVNGADPKSYRELRQRFPCRWLFAKQPLGFGEAVYRALRAARFDWVYLLNSDVTIEPRALAILLPHRAPDVFAIGSQIFLKDRTRYREETNFTVFLMENGLATVHDRIPEGSEVREMFYAGGGASLFRRKALLPLARASRAYAPFYWEDVEWGWRARKLRYRVLFCPASIAHHTHRATIARHYDPDAIETVIERNRLLFQLRNLTDVPLDRLLEGIARSPAETAGYFLRRGVLWESLRVRLWNHLALRHR